MQWWPGRIKATPQPTAAEVGNTYSLQYEAMDDFEAEEATITILGERARLFTHPLLRPARVAFRTVMALVAPVAVWGVLWAHTGQAAVIWRQTCAELLHDVCRQQRAMRAHELASWVS